MATREMTTKGALTLGATGRRDAPCVAGTAGALPGGSYAMLAAGRGRKAELSERSTPMYLPRLRMCVPAGDLSTPVAFPAGQTVENNKANKNYENDGVWRQQCQRKMRKNTEK